MPIQADDLLAEILKPADSGGASYSWKTVLINCDCHTFDDVEGVAIAIDQNGFPGIACAAGIGRLQNFR